MAEKKEESKGVSRRQFVTWAGAAVVTSIMAGLAACKLAVKEEEQEVPTSKEEVPKEEAPKEEVQEVLISGVIVHNPEKCVGCGVCGLMCSLYHEGEQGPALSRSEVVRDPFNYDFTFNVCQQCRSPSCYFACPLKDTALCIDEVTGVRYINKNECDGCGKCIEACPFDPVRVKMHPEKNIAFNCDLCKDRDEGPICVEYCTMNALTYVTKDERKEDGEVLRLDRKNTMG